MAASKGAYARLVRRERKLEISRAYAEILEGDIRAKAERRTEDFAREARRELVGKNIALVEREKLIDTVYTKKLEDFRHDLHLEYCMAREDAKRRAEKTPEQKATLEESLEARLKSYEKRIAEYGAGLKDEIGAQLPPPASREAIEAAEEKIAAAVAAYDKIGKAKAEKRIAAVRKRAENKAIRLEKSCARQAARIAGPEAAEALPEDVVLKVENLCMYFGGIHAVDSLSFNVKKGEIFGLIGPNGAGKTTVFNCITQFYKPTGGRLLFRNRAGKTVCLTDVKVHDVILQGIVRTFQNVEVIREVTVLENLLIAGHRLYTAGVAAQALHLPVLRREERVVREKALRVLDFMGLSEYRDWYAFGLPYGILKKIEIARTLMCSPQLIILDEPAAGLNDTETGELAHLISRIRDEYGCTVLLVEHDMGLVMDICETVCAISFGRLLAIGTPAEIQADKNVQKAYLGESDEKPEGVPGKECV